ncbi:MAG TPA: hypothetical protein VKT20_07990, partial [Candidatus Dormibacteraeota bacterium]|nr:hypothetical protein [Candidatus Dormibacteraeota bacterium]
AALGIAVMVFILAPTGIGIVCGVLLVWQSLAWATAPAAGLFAQRIALTPSRNAFSRSPQTTGARPSVLSGRPRRAALAAVLVALAIVLTPAIATSPVVDSSLNQALAAVPSPVPLFPSPQPAAPSSKPLAARSPAVSPVTAKPTPTALPSPSLRPSSSPSPSASATPSHPVASPSPRATALPTPSARP